MLQRLKIGQRLALGFGLLLALFTVMLAGAFWQMSRLADVSRYYAENLVPSYEAEHEIALTLSNVRRFEFRHVLSNSADEMGRIETRITDDRRKVAAALERYGKDLVSDDRDRALLNSARTAFAAYANVWDQQVLPVSRATVTDPTKTEEARLLMIGTSAQAYEAAQTAVSAWWAYNVELARNQEHTAESTHKTALTALAALGVAAVLFGLLSGALITRSITRPLGQAAQLAEAVASGDLTARVETQGADETAELLRSLTHMNENLSRIVGQVRASSDSIATGASQIAGGNADLSQRTEQQASNLQQTAASMEELSSTVKINADTAGQASAMARSASEAAAHGGEVVNRVVGTMEEITTSSRKIADIIGVIDGIAFQTNILALNAAVEAARAGEQGRGFAVVASEVRNLAGRAADAAKEIKTLIHSSVERVEVGATLANDAGRSMQDIVTQVQHVSQLIAEISNATQEQSTGISQVGEAVSQLDQVTQQNAALVEESAAASESLRHQAGQLADLVRQFRTDDSPLPRTAPPAVAMAAAVPRAVHPATPRAAARPPVAAAPSGRRGAGPAATKSAAAPGPVLANADDWSSF